MLKRLFSRFARAVGGDAPARRSAMEASPPSREALAVGGVDYVYPWRRLPEGGFEDRLEFEITEGHPLWGETPQVIGHSEASDDVAVALADGRYAIVHLTWGAEPGDDRFPLTTFYATAADLSQALCSWSEGDEVSQ